MDSFTLPPHTQALMFDADGTLIDTWSLHRAVWSELFATHGFTVTDVWWEEYAHEDLLTMVQAVLPGADEAMAYDMNAEGTRIYHQSLDRVERIHHVTELAEAFHGSLPMAVVTAGFREVVMPTLEAVGIAHLFDAVVTGDDVPQIKPAPDGYRLAAQLLNVDSAHCVVFEDSDSGLTAARAAGIGTMVDVRGSRLTVV